MKQLIENLTNDAEAELQRTAKSILA
jgi:hypothetical protein